MIAGFPLTLRNYSYSLWFYVEQGSSNLSLEGQSAAQFSSNPDQSHLPVIQMILKTLISMLRSVWLGLEINSDLRMADVEHHWY